MIRSLSDLLSEFVKKEVELLNEQQIKHPITIGAMYEGLTEEVMNRSIFDGLNLNVVKNSFLEGCDTEFDIMLVEGEGTPIPYTNRFIYPAKNVIAIIQVKKNLYTKDIKDGYENLKFIIKYYNNSTYEPFMTDLFRDAFRGICRKDISAKRLNLLSSEEEAIYYTLLDEACLPVRIVWGYNGFTSEYNFRESFNEYIRSNISIDMNNKIHGYAPWNFPNLIICGTYTMIKNNGMPYMPPVDKDNWWSFFTSSSYNPTNFFLELIWTRLSYKYELPADIFGEDLEQEPHNRYLDCRIQRKDEFLGWEYNYITISDENLSTHVHSGDWSPVFLDLPQFVFIQRLCKDEINLENEPTLEKFVQSEGYDSLSSFIESLQKTGLIYTENNIVRLLTDQCQCAVLPGGRFVAGENKTGRLMRWVMKDMKKNKENI